MLKNQSRGYVHDRLTAMAIAFPPLTSRKCDNGKKKKKKLFKE